MKFFSKTTALAVVIAVIAMGTPVYAAGSYAQIDVVTGMLVTGTPSTYGTDTISVATNNLPGAGWYRFVAKGGGTTTISYNGTNYGGCFNFYYNGTTNQQYNLLVKTQGGASTLLESGTCASDNQGAGTFKLVDVYTCTNGTYDTFNHPKFVILEFNQNLSQGNNKSDAYPNEVGYSPMGTEYITKNGKKNAVRGVQIHNNRLMLAFWDAPPGSFGNDIEYIGSGYTFTNPITFKVWNFYLNKSVSVNETNRTVKVKNNCGDFSTQEADTRFDSMLWQNSTYLDRITPVIEPAYEVERTDYTSQQSSRLGTRLR